jgi:hypothetical protein
MVQRYGVEIGVFRSYTLCSRYTLVFDLRIINCGRTWSDANLPVCHSVQRLVVRGYVCHLLGVSSQLVRNTFAEGIRAVMITRVDVPARKAF